MSVKAYAAKAAKAKLEPFEYEPGPLGAEEVEAVGRVRSGKVHFRAVLTV